MLNLPYTAYCNLLPLLTDTLPAFDEICRRSAQFISSCLNSDSYLVRTVARHGVEVARYNSCVHVLVVIYWSAVITLNGDYLIFMKVESHLHIPVFSTFLCLNC